MIIRFAKPGKSFKGLAAYLTHDGGKAKTSDRIAWTHTLNLANDEIPAAVDEMELTCHAADGLKRQAGISPGGRKLESPVKHFSLNWHPGDKPSPEEMLAAVQDFLRHMDWSDRQAVLVAHNDKPYEHVHIMMNAVSPVDGRTLDTSFERVRASSWALSYERQQFRIHCSQRLKPYEQREPSPSREAWKRLRDAEAENDKAEFERLAQTPDYFERGDPDARNSKEWAVLKAHQRARREGFFIEGKQAFRAERNRIFREVRTEYRNEWMTYFDSARRGLDAESLAELKTDIVTRQNADLDARRDEACKELRARRDIEYQRLLRQQREERAWLAARQKQRLATPQVLSLAHEPPDQANKRERGEFPAERAKANFRAAALETTSPPGERKSNARPVGDVHVSAGRRTRERHRVKDGTSAAADIGIGALGAVAEVAERLFDGFFGGGAPAAAPEPPMETTRKSPEEDERARETEKQIRTGEEEAAEAARLHAYWQERRQRRRDRD